MDTIPTLLPDAPPEVKKLIELLANPSLTTMDVDQEMGWPEGETRRKLKQYPLLAKTANEARVIAFRAVGLDAPRIAAFRAIADALTATKREQCGNFEYVEVPDHGTRLKAANQILKVLGDDASVIAEAGKDVELHLKIYNIVNQRKTAKVIDVDKAGVVTSTRTGGLEVVT